MKVRIVLGDEMDQEIVNILLSVHRVLKDKICQGMYRMMLQINIQYQTLMCFTGMLKEAKIIAIVILLSPKDSIM